MSQSIQIIRIMLRIRDFPMWKLKNGNLVHTITSSRVEFRTNISKSILESLKRIAEKNNTRH